MIGVNGPAVSADDVSVEYRRSLGHQRALAVDGVTLTIRRGEVLALLGGSGSGKSTFAAAVAGELGKGAATPVAGVGTSPGTARRRIVGGELTVLGQRVRHLPAHSRSRTRLTGLIGWLPQDAADRLSPDLVVGEVVAEPIYARDRRFDRRAAGLMVARLIDAVRLPLGIMRKHTWELSSGQRQRVALARALVLEPQLLVADEPARGVDVLVRHSVLEALADLQRERGFSALVVSSELQEARALADRLAVLADGRLVGLGTFDEVLDAPTHPYVTALAATAGRITRSVAPTSRRATARRVEPV